MAHLSRLHEFKTYLRERCNEHRCRIEIRSFGSQNSRQQARPRNYGAGAGHESSLLFHHSSRVHYWGALAGKRRGFKFDPELLYAGAMFHDMGLTHQHSSQTERFEVDGANVARDFLRSHGIAQQDIDTVWTAIALHTTPGIPQHMHPVVALVTAGVEMDVLGLAYSEYSEA